MHRFGDAATPPTGQTHPGFGQGVGSGGFFGSVSPAEGGRYTSKGNQKPKKGTDDGSLATAAVISDSSAEQRPEVDRPRSTACCESGAANRGTTRFEEHAGKHVIRGRRLCWEERSFGFVDRLHFGEGGSLRGRSRSNAEERDEERGEFQRDMASRWGATEAQSNVLARCETVPVMSRWASAGGAVRNTVFGWCVGLQRRLGRKCPGNGASHQASQGCREVGRPTNGATVGSKRCFGIVDGTNGKRAIGRSDAERLSARSKPLKGTALRWRSTRVRELVRQFHDHGGLNAVNPMSGTRLQNVWSL